MTKDQSYVALKPFRFGAETLQPGDPVPQEAGRDYRLMLRLGQIGLASAAPAGQQEDQAHSTFEEGEEVLVVYGDGTYDRATFKHYAEADEQARESLELEAGDLVATITTEEAPDDEIVVPLSSVLPMHPVGLLLDHLESRARENHEAVVALGGKDQEVNALKGRVDFLELLLNAIRTEGTPLSEDTPSIKDLQANHITTVEGLKLLAEGERGRANLIALDKIGDKSADKILTFLNPPKGE
ncbi:hypothetical protein Dxin01_02761 [Deinococcus xinjiangensis]|uniref:Uncharacterized protein n=1 Tax=Deinococcus xinjiangensis TaxID=457454 RepID=A0ABP9VCP9_9DEIO